MGYCYTGACLGHAETILFFMSGKFFSNCHENILSHQNLTLILTFKKKDLKLNGGRGIDWLNSWMAMSVPSHFSSSFPAQTVTVVLAYSGLVPVTRPAMIDMHKVHTYLAENVTHTPIIKII